MMTGGIPPMKWKAPEIVVMNETFLCLITEGCELELQALNMAIQASSRTNNSVV